MFSLKYPDFHEKIIYPILEKHSGDLKNCSTVNDTNQEQKILSISEEILNAVLGNLDKLDT